MTKKLLLGLTVVLTPGLCVSAQQKTSSQPSPFQNQRLKTLKLQDRQITGDNDLRLVTGYWVPESNDPSKALVLPQQVKVTCTRSAKTCKELSITLAPTPQLVSIQDVDEQDYDVDSWDAHGLVASFGGGEGLNSRCQRHVLTMDFDSGAVSVTDIPTHKKGCESFLETNSYRLIRGNYYVDTTPGNNVDQQKKVSPAGPQPSRKPISNHRRIQNRILNWLPVLIVEARPCSGQPCRSPGRGSNLSAYRVRIL